MFILTSKAESTSPPSVYLGRQPGEILAMLNCGAYSLAQASQYNGRFLPSVVLIKEDSMPQVIRKRDGFEDLVRNDVF